MNIGLLGYGKMGKMLHMVAEQRKNVVSEIVDGDKNFKGNAEVFIDFSAPEAVLQNIERCGEKKIPLVVGTTGWLANKEEAEKLARKYGIPVVYSGNFSLGVNLFWRSLEKVTQEFSAFSAEYDVFLHEFHHRQKTDAPSGTALTTAEIVQKNFPSKTEMLPEAPKERKILENELQCTATRGGFIPGTHSVFFDSTYDTVELTHRARNREGFALGAIMMAEKISVIPAGLHHFPDIFDEVFGRK